jgi:hypothetical protein
MNDSTGRRPTFLKGKLGNGNSPKAYKRIYMNQISEAMDVALYLITSSAVPIPPSNNTLLFASQFRAGFIDKSSHYNGRFKIFLFHTGSMNLYTSLKYQLFQDSTKVFRFTFAIVKYYDSSFSYDGFGLSKKSVKTTTPDRSVITMDDDRSRPAHALA